MSKSKVKAKQLEDSSESDSGPDDRNEPPSKKPKPAPAKKPQKASANSGGGDDGDQMFQLGRMRYVSVREFRGRTMIDIREYYDKDGETRPGKKGIALNVEQWTALKGHIDDIDAAVQNIS